jgi:hypothetical protein
LRLPSCHRGAGRPRLCRSRRGAAWSLP